ncbi:MAG TPA: class I SAM-dependent methyltransferase [Terracidiphilus sp.]|jgi:SAM-dependent methyltransferase
MSTLALYTWIVRSLKGIEGWSAVRASLVNAFRRINSRLAPKHPFDRKHGVDTDGLMYAEELASGHTHDVYSAGYYGSAPSLVQGAIARWAETLTGTRLELSDYTLLDIGCGKGRVVMLAAESPFRAVVGVELHPGLARVAGKNLRKWLRKPRACRDVRIVQSDVLSLSFPDGPVAIYFFNPFEREMVELLLARLSALAARRTEPIDLIYVHPEFGELVQSAQGVELLADVDVPFSEEDARADVFGVDSDRCAIYRLRGVGFSQVIRRGGQDQGRPSPGV